MHNLCFFPFTAYIYATSHMYIQRFTSIIY